MVQPKALHAFPSKQFLKRQGPRFANVASNLKAETNLGTVRKQVHSENPPRVGKAEALHFPQATWTRAKFRIKYKLYFCALAKFLNPFNC